MQRSLPILILPIDRCPLRNESLGLCRLSIITGTQKSLVDVRRALQGKVSVCSHGAGVASYLCLLSRLRRAATLTIASTLISFSLGLGRAELVRGFFSRLPPLPAPSALPRLRELMRVMCDAITAHVLEDMVMLRGTSNVSKSQKVLNIFSGHVRSHTGTPARVTGT